MRRRDFISFVGGAAAWPLAAQAQKVDKIYLIGILAPERQPAAYLEIFRQGLRELGYVEGQNMTFAVRSAEGYSQQLAALANELVGRKVDVILAINTPVSAGRQEGKRDGSVCMMRTADPVKSGLVRSLSKPGGNVTGLTSIVDELSGKRLALLKEAFPGVSRVAVLWFEPNPGSEIAVDALKVASRKLGLELLPLPVHGQADLIKAFQTATRSRVQALIVIEDSVATKYRGEILNLAATHSLPAISQYKAFAEAGALLAYGPSPSEMYRRAAYYVDRILKGANAGDLPVEQPTKFDLVINMKTARALGVTIPPTLLTSADELIE
jgi:putative ABC transport system substrate-binding protein